MCYLKLFVFVSCFHNGLSCGDDDKRLGECCNSTKAWMAKARSEFAFSFFERCDNVSSPSNLTAMASNLRAMASNLLLSLFTGQVVPNMVFVSIAAATAMATAGGKSRSLFVGQSRRGTPT